MNPVYNDSVPLEIEPNEALSRARSTFIAAGLSVSSESHGELTLKGRGMSSTKQPSILAITDGTLTANGGMLQLTADLGGLRFLQRFSLFFPIGMVIGMVLLQHLIFAVIRLRVPNVHSSPINLHHEAGMTAAMLGLGFFLCVYVTGKIKRDLHRTLTSLASK